MIEKCICFTLFLFFFLGSVTAINYTINVDVGNQYYHKGDAVSIVVAVTHQNGTPAESETIYAVVYYPNTSLLANLSMAELSPGFYKNSTNLTTDTPYGDYTVFVYSSNKYASSAIFQVQTVQDRDLSLWALLFIVFFALLGLAFWTENYMFSFIAGCLILLMGVWAFSSGISIYSVDEYWMYPFAFILTGIGIFLTITSSVKWIAQEEGEVMDTNYDYFSSGDWGFGSEGGDEE